MGRRKKIVKEEVNINFKVSEEVYNILNSFALDILGVKSLNFLIKNRLYYLAQRISTFYNPNRVYSLQDKLKLRQEYLKIISNYDDLESI